MVAEMLLCSDLGSTMCHRHYDCVRPCNGTAPTPIAIAPAWLWPLVGGATGLVTPTCEFPRLSSTIRVTLVANNNWLLIQRLRICDSASGCFLTLPRCVATCTAGDVVHTGGGYTASSARMTRYYRLRQFGGELWIFSFVDVPESKYFVVMRSRSWHNLFYVRWTIDGHTFG